MRNYLSVSLWMSLGIVTACATSDYTKNQAPKLEELLKLRGQSRQAVEAALGAPNDSRANTQFYFVVDQDGYAAEPVLYELHYDQDRLQSVKRSSSAPSK
jgi:hypothetical protein